VKKTITKKDWCWLKVQALSSSLSMAKKKRKEFKATTNEIY
jgi:hypothetical protein